jgi:hypothetical protein
MCRPRSSGPCSATSWCTRSGDHGARPATGARRRGRERQGRRLLAEGSKRYGFRYPVSVEEILDVEPGKRLACTVLRGIPVRNYRAEVTLTPSPDGTLIRWGASWDRTILGRLVHRPLRHLYPVIVAGLAKAAATQPPVPAILLTRHPLVDHPPRDPQQVRLPV